MQLQCLNEVKLQPTVGARWELAVINRHAAVAGMIIITVE